MMNSHMEFHATAPYSRELKDCRVVYFEVEFHETARETMIEAGLEYFRAINEFEAGQFASSWNVNDRSLSEKRISEAVYKCDLSLRILHESNVRTETLRTKTDLRKYLRDQQFDLSLPRMHYYSSDFPQYFYEHLMPTVQDEVSFRDALLRLFQEPGKNNTGYMRGPDASGLFYGGFSQNIGAYRGRLFYAIFIGCLSGAVNQTAACFSSVIKRLCSILKSANGRVGICPYPFGLGSISPYMRYFGMNCDERDQLGDGSHIEVNRHPVQWYPYYYLCGAEWANVISKLTMSHLSENDVNSLHASDAIQFEKMPGGSAFVQLKKDLEHVDIVDYAPLKQLLYPALFPGRYEFNLPDKTGESFFSTFPRSNWECIWIRPDEVSVQRNRIIFQHVNGALA